ncbi:MAG: UvrD-helicase domain-containing protein [Sphingomonadaceae bacterium]|nr:UvrD-helicase domain-containing protein [Sphingomonadaceae bacterium]
MQTARAEPAPDPGYLTGLNAPQREAVLTVDGPVLLLAGAGTGKTRALTARLAHLVATRRAWPAEILAVTFTNKAAREMRERVGALIGQAVEGMPWLGTFHAIGARMLRRHAELVALKQNFTILDTDDQLRLIKQVIAEADLDERRWPARLLGGLIDRWKNRGERPEQVPPGEAQAFADGQGAKLYARYQQRLSALNACDFGDLLLHNLTILTQHPDVLEQYQRRFKYMLVDEYQDTNIAQYLWLRLLAQGHRNICMVGDDDQSIYSWRGAEVANILKFEQDFPGAKVIRLEQNYRSTPHILGAAGGVIGQNRGRLGKKLWTEARGGEKVRVVGVWDGPEEARVVGDEIETLQRQGAGLNDVAILVRAGFQTREFEDRFVAIGLPYRIIGGFRFYERKEIRDALAYFRVVLSPADDLAFERIVNVPKRGLGEKSLAALHAAARARAVSLALIAEDMADSDELAGAARRGLADLGRSLRRWRELLPSLPHTELARLILEESGYTAMLQADRSAEAAGRLDNLQELVRAMEEFDSLSGFLDHVSLVMDNDADADSEKVTLMTLHAAKGLEFPYVFLPGWEEGVFPSQRSMDEGGTAALEEERRLAYVGLTRARLRAWVLYAANRRVYGSWQSSLPSRFVAELPREHIDEERTMSGGSSMWAAASGYGDPFAHVARSGARGPGWQRAAASGGLGARAAPGGGGAMLEGSARHLPVGAPASGAFAPGSRVFHDKFGYGAVVSVEGNKLEIDFEKSGVKRVLDSFVRVA